MTIGDFSRLWRHLDWPIETALAVAGIFGAIRRDPKDRVLLLEFLALISLFLGALALKISGFHMLGCVLRVC